jgi:hypothetical protein
MSFNVILNLQRVTKHANEQMVGVIISFGVVVPAFVEDVFQSEGM